MHMLMHCLFRHMFSAKQHEDAQLWDLCCDIAVESVVDSMDYPTILRVTSGFSGRSGMKNWKRKFQCFTAEKLFRVLSCATAIPYLEESLRQEFSLCDHSFWQAQWRKKRRQKQNKNQPGARRIRRMDVIRRKMPGGKRLMQRRFGKTNPQRKTESKVYRKRYENLCKKTQRACTPLLHGCYKLKAVREPKSYKRIFKEVCSCEKKFPVGYGFV